MVDRGVLPGREEQAGLDHYQVRSYRAWHVHITLGMLAAAYLAVSRATAHNREGEKGDLQRSVRSGGQSRAAADVRRDKSRVPSRSAH
jgi:SRSO17 transposase